MNNTRGGFTLIEMVITVSVALILLNVALSASGPAFDRMTVSSARTSFAALHARARARAVERGRNVRLSVDPATDSAWVSDGTEIIEAVAFGTDSGIDIRTPALMELCLGPRGYADTDCNSFTSAVKLEFTRRAASAAVQVRPLGQLVMED